MFEVDLLYAGFDLVHFYQGKMSLRRLTLLAMGLPKDSRVHAELMRREFNGEEPWGASEILAAATVDALRYSNYLQQYNMWMRADEKTRGVPPEMPKQIRPPGFQPDEPEHEMDKTIEFGTRADWDALMELT